MLPVVLSQFSVKDDEFDHIEARLAVQLPQKYRRFAADYPADLREPGHSGPKPAMSPPRTPRKATEGPLCSVGYQSHFRRKPVIGLSGSRHTGDLTAGHQPQ